MRKAQKKKKDVWIAISEWCNAPTPGSTSSPAQRLMSRRTRSLLPCIQQRNAETRRSTATYNRATHSQTFRSSIYDSL